MLVYKKRNTMLQQLHPLTGVILILIYIVSILAVNNPVYLGIIILSLLLLSAVDSSLGEMGDYIKVILPVLIFIVILNPLFNHNGRVVIYEGPRVPVVGSLRITAESLAYGLFTAVRLMGITLAFGFGNLILHPDRTFTYFSKYMGNSALLMNMTFRLFPTILKSLNNIIEVEKIRGNAMGKMGLGKKIKSYSNILNILFQTCIEDAGDLAESMHSRAYGTGKRSIYFDEGFKKSDVLFGIIFIMILGTYLFTKYHFGIDNDFNHFITNPAGNIKLMGLILSMLFIMPALLNWGWRTWK